MCGIVGYLGSRDAVPVLLDALNLLEYRGYDSAGLSVMSGRTIHTIKRVGKVQKLSDASQHLLNQSTFGIAHTRWATHGEPSVKNAHPHMDCTACVSVVHNGIIENYAALKAKLEPYHRFVSDTDSEVIAHLIEEFLKTEGTFEKAVLRTLNELKGTFGLAAIFAFEPNMLIAARKGSPLSIGIGEEEYFLASDPSVFRQFTERVLFLSDGEVAVISPNGVSLKTVQNISIDRESERFETEYEELGKAGYANFMEKEIFEQSVSIVDAMRGRINDAEGSAVFGGISEWLTLLAEARRLILVGCGTSWHAALAGEYMLEQYAHISVEVDYASEFRYRNPVIESGDIVIVLSQSGETADTIAAMTEAKRKGALVFAICNVVGSTIARTSDGGIYMHAGREIGVASTKAYTSQLMVLALLTLAIARKKRLIQSEGEKIISEMRALPQKIEHILSLNDKIAKIAARISGSANAIYLGRGINFPNALEGALKVKEISYLHAEGYPAAEMKHGPIALIDADMPVIVIAPKDDTYDKVINNIQEVRARKGKVIAVIDEDDKRISAMCDDVIIIPATIDLLSPILTIIPLQLLAYHIAVQRGCNVDQPRNLAKSVTVE